MRGIELGHVGLRVGFVPPLQRGEIWLVTFTWGFARRSTPGCHVAGLSALTLRSFGPVELFCLNEMKSSTTQPTTAQHLGARLKYARDIMRRLKRLQGESKRGCPQARFSTMSGHSGPSMAFTG